MTKPKIDASTFVLTDPNDILQALVAVKEVKILFYRRVKRECEIALEQVTGNVRCKDCNGAVRVKDRRWVRYVALRD